MAPSPFVFTFYTEEELVACGDAFLASCKQEWQQTGTAAWTEYVLNWFYNTARSGVCVDARTPQGSEIPRRETNGEWLVDLAHTTYPKLGRHEYWKNALDCTAAKEANSLEHALEILRRRTGDHAPWLWINLPDEETTKSCQYVMFGQKARIRQVCL